MMFLFKKKKLVINCFTDRHDVATYAPIKPAHAFYPDWWKSLPKLYPMQTRSTGGPTMKTCVGMRDLYQHGLVLPMWCELSMDIGEVGDIRYRYDFADRRSSLDAHPAPQRGSFADEKLYQHIKINSPWFFSCDEAIPFAWIEPTWNIEDLTQYRVLPAMVDFRHQHATHVNFILPRKPKEVSTVIIPFSTPLVHMTPLTERELDIRVIEDPQMCDRLKIARVSFANSYKLVKNMNKGKCPVGFGS